MPSALLAIFVLFHNGIKSSFNPKIYFKGRYFSDNVFKKNQTDRFMLGKPVHDLNFGINIKFSSDFEGYTILNVDETWLGMADFRRRKWKVHGTTNSHAILQVRPRITMITGLDTKGNIYVSLLQSNSNSKVLELFFQNLVKKLSDERRYWRKDTVVLLDNAAYHKSGAAMKMFEKLQIPLIFTGPHSYDAAPIELLFAAFKSEDINPRCVATGKK